MMHDLTGSALKPFPSWQLAEVLTHSERERESCTHGERETELERIERERAAHAEREESCRGADCVGVDGVWEEDISTTKMTIAQRKTEIKHF